MDDLSLKLRGVVGILVILTVLFLLSKSRKNVRPRIIFWGLTLQFIFALIVLRTDFGAAFFHGANKVIIGLLEFSQHGSNFVFGALSPKPGEESDLGYIFFFQTLTTIIFFAALMGVLYHIGVMQMIVRAVAWLMRITLKTSGAETLSASANIFVGQTEAPLLVKPFVGKMTNSEIMAVMTGGFATVAGGVMAAYVAECKDVFPDIAGHLMAASVMAAPAGLMISKILIPEIDQPATSGSVPIHVDTGAANVIDAAAGGASDGMKLVLNVAAMLLAFVALVMVIDFGLGYVGSFFGYDGLSLTGILQYVLSPLAYMMGIQGDDVMKVSHLLGEKLVLTEFVAYRDLGTMREELSERSFMMASYALCGFANLASIAIQIGGIGSIAPERRADLARIGPRAMLAGFLTTCLTATVAGIII